MDNKCLFFYRSWINDYLTLYHDAQNQMPGTGDWALRRFGQEYISGEHYVTWWNENSPNITGPLKNTKLLLEPVPLDPNSIQNKYYFVFETTEKCVEFMIRYG